MSPTSTKKYSSDSSLVRSRRAFTSSMNSSNGDDGSGTKLLGCQLFSTGFSSGRTHCEAHPSSDLKTSNFSGGNECVLRTFDGGDTERTHFGGRLRWRTVLGVHAKERVVCMSMVVDEGVVDIFVSENLSFDLAINI
ncbi:hypothetical protein V8G54_037642 [Vigna mungo]|uniref:Uncharacterized protein n=1 Tax=Vigna mungo TaxID=3915 RepID=A0AAQ3RGP5_VIGMU